MSDLLSVKVRSSIIAFCFGLFELCAFGADSGSENNSLVEFGASRAQAYSLPLSGSFGNRAGGYFVDSILYTVDGYCVLAFLFNDPLLIKTELRPPCELMTHGHPHFLPRVSSRQVDKKITVGLHVVGNLVSKEPGQVACSKDWQNLYLYWPRGFPTTDSDTSKWPAPQWALGNLSVDSRLEKEPPHCFRWLINTYPGGLP